MSESERLLLNKMLEKNFHIKQRFVNEAQPFISYNSQNLLKLPSEQHGRVRLTNDINSQTGMDKNMLL